MKIINTKIKDLKLIKINEFKDKRGAFKEIYKKKIIGKDFIFDCTSTSKRKVIRGLHFQTTKPQAKFLSVLYGEIFDVAVDLRVNSKTFGKYFAIKISDKSNLSILIPEGFAHGFQCLSSKCIVYYKCNNYRNIKSETSIIWNDKDIKIKWPLKNPILSKKDMDAKALSELIRTKKIK